MYKISNFNSLQLASNKFPIITPLPTYTSTALTHPNPAPSHNLTLKHRNSIKDFTQLVNIVSHYADYPVRC